MSVLYIVGLALLVLVCFAIGQGTNTAALLATIVFFAGGLILYFIPTIVAFRREHPNRTAIALLNLFLGWTFIGWVVAVVWAHSAKQQHVVVEQPAQRLPDPAWLRPVAAAVPPMAEVSAKRDTRACPFCAEEVLAAAIKCKHCGSDISSPAPGNL